MGHTARGVGSNTVGAVLKQVVKMSNVFVRGATLFGFVFIYSTGVNFDVYDCFVGSYRLKFVSKLLDSHYLARLFVHHESAGDVVAVEAE